MVAVKQLAQDGVQGRNEFLVEVLMLTVLNHPNLVSLVGFCAQGDERLLVYEYMPFGSLESHLFGNLFSSNFLFFLFGMFRGLSFFLIGSGVCLFLQTTGINLNVWLLFFPFDFSDTSLHLIPCML